MHTMDSEYGNAAADAVQDAVTVNAHGFLTKEKEKLVTVSAYYSRALRKVGKLSRLSR